MLSIRHTRHFRIEKPTILTIGTFDGVHLGHQKILSRLQQLKQRHGLNTVVLTFDPHPRKVLFPEQKDLKLLTLTNEKLNLLENYGVDIAVVYPFDKDFSNIDAEAYVKEFLVHDLKVKHLVIGYDHHFGKGRGGNIHLLKGLEQKYGFSLEEIDALDIDKISVSSSKIRHALESGNIVLANSFLGHSYFLEATVVSGKKLGRQLGYPTANLKIEEEDKLIPKIGVYFVEVIVDGQPYYGMMNIGLNPTTDEDQALKLEVNIFEFNREIYGKVIRVNFLNYLRDEQKFESLDALIKAIDQDKRNCLELIKQTESTICRL